MVSKQLGPQKAMGEKILRTTPAFRLKSAGCRTHLRLFKVKNTNTVNSSPKWPGYLGLEGRESSAGRSVLLKHQAVDAQTQSTAQQGLKHGFTSILTSFSAYDGTRPSNFPSVSAIMILEVCKPPAFWICSFAWKWRIIIQLTI